MSEKTLQQRFDDLVKKYTISQKQLRTKILEIDYLNDQIKKLKSENGILKRKYNPLKTDNIQTDIDINKLRDIIENKFLVDISSIKRDAQIVYARQLFHYWLLMNTNMTLKQIGGMFGYDHSTVINSRSKIQNYLSYDKKVIKDYADICLKMKGQLNEISIVINPS